MTPQYEMIRNIFIQSSLTDIILEQKVQALENNYTRIGELRYWFWRYVFMKDLTKKALTNKLLKAGFDNLTTIEIINSLNSVREIVKELIENAEKRYI